MRTNILISLIIFSTLLASVAALPVEVKAAFPDVELRNILGKPIPLSQFEGRVLLVTNTASQCGFTPQYKELEGLHQRFRSQGFSVLGFPSNDFGGQEPDSNEEIRKFCKTRFNVSFPLFEKGTVTGENAHPFFKFLTSSDSPELRGPIQWNFEKFLVDRTGQVRARFRSRVRPQDDRVVSEIERLLAEQEQP